MHHHDAVSDSSLFRMLRKGEISLAGHKKLHIYGRLGCRSGKRMNKTNRVFFIDETEAHSMGFRPCGHCMKEQYKLWKDGTV